MNKFPVAQLEENCIGTTKGNTTDPYNAYKNVAGLKIKNWVLFRKSTFKDL